MFKKSGSIGSEVYSPLAGRVFNGTWGGRKTAGALMELPADFLEHTARLQNWNDTGPVPTIGWGQQYADGARVQTSGKGSFDAVGLPTWAAAAQFLDDAYSDELKESICKNFFLANWQNPNGSECVESLSKAAGAPVATITLSDIMDREGIELQEPDETTIYAEPFVNYALNPASGEYDKRIRVLNARATAFSTSFVEGLSGTRAMNLWNVCHSLALKTKAINAPPSDLTDLIWANGPNDDEIATQYLEKWAAWQSNREISIPLHVNTAISWGESERFNLVLPQQTNGESKQCIVERITIDPNPPHRAIVQAIMV